MTVECVDAYVAVGSNVEPRRNIPAAAAMLAELAPLTGASTFYRTESIGPDGLPDGQPEFLNGVLRVRAPWDARTMKHEILRGIEDRLGRDRSAGRFAPRTIDLDLVLYGRQVIDEPGLRIPAPEIDRPFVALAVLEIDPDLVLPHTRQPLACLWPGGSPAGAMTPDAECTRQLKEYVRP